MIHHAPPPGADQGPADLAEVERRLADWFDAEVVLTSSGRAGLLLAFQDLGLGRYRDRIAMSPMTAACVFDAVIRCAFPVDPASDKGAVSATLLIQQYGLVQDWRPEGPVIEDICHAFFAAPDRGARDWAGDYAVVSLPKFFPLAGMAGAVITRSPEIAARLRARVAAAPTAPAESARRLFQRQHERAGAELEAMYLGRLLDPAPDPWCLAGLPDFRQAGARRREIVERLLAAAPAPAIASGWRARLRAQPPFALPIFGDEKWLGRLDAALAAEGIAAGIYLIDRARDNRSPNWRRAVLVPCHQAMSDDNVRAVEGTLAR